MSTRRLRPFALTLLLCAGATVAHDNRYFDSHPTPHGGQVRMAGAYHVEAVLEQRQLVLYVTDHGDQPQSTAGWHGRATVVNGAEVVRLTLTAVGDNRLHGNMPVSFGADTRMVVLLHPPMAEALQLDYTPAAAQGVAAARP